MNLYASLPQSPGADLFSLRGTFATTDSDHLVSILSGTFEIIDELAPRWRELSDEIPNAEPFHRPEFVRAYMRAFEPKKRLFLVVASQGQKVDAVLPLVSESALLCGLPVKRLRGPANVHSCHFDLVRSAKPGGDAAVRAMWRCLRQLSGWDVLEFPRVPADGAVHQLLDQARADGFSTKARPAGFGPHINLTNWPGFPEVWPASISSGFRRTVQRSDRNLRKQGNLRFRRVEIAADFFPGFHALERASWKGQEATAIDSNADTQQFYSDISRAAEEFRYLCCHLLELDDRVVAGSFGLSYKRRFFGLKISYDEAFRSCSPGHLVVRSILQDCAERQFTELNLMPPWSEWKARWTADAREQSNWYIFRNSRYGHLLDHVKFSFVPMIKSVAQHFVQNPGPPSDQPSSLHEN
jgi:CelD/BcsL family acetyltransferase involved in cellulose biosynthesis